MKRGALGNSAKGTLADLFAKRSRTSEQVIDIDEVDATAEDVIAHECVAVSEETAPDAVDGDAIDPSDSKKKRFRISQDDPELAYLEYKNMKNKKGAVTVHWNCKACSAGKESTWSEFKSDAVLKHIGKCYSDKGVLVARTDRCKGGVHRNKVVLYEQALQAAPKPSAQLDFSRT
jgi:hypothetical protein